MVLSIVTSLSFHLSLDELGLVGSGLLVGFFSLELLLLLFRCLFFLRNDLRVLQMMLLMGIVMTLS